MRALTAILVAIAGSLTPDLTLWWMTFRARVDRLATSATALLAVVLAVGYQLLRFWARRLDRPA